MHERENEKQAAQQEFVGDRIEILAEQGLLFEPARKHTVERVAESGGDKEQQSPSVVLVQNINDDKGNEDESQQRELIGDRAGIERSLALPPSGRAGESEDLFGRNSGLCGELLGEGWDGSIFSIEFYLLNPQ